MSKPPIADKDKNNNNVKNRIAFLFADFIRTDAKTPKAIPMANGNAIIPTTVSGEVPALPCVPPMIDITLKKTTTNATA